MNQQAIIEARERLKQAYEKDIAVLDAAERILDRLEKPTVPPEPAVTEPVVVAPPKRPALGATHGKLMPAMRALIPMLAQPFTPKQLREELERNHPTLIQPKHIPAIAVNLLDMAERGELIRQGSGRGLRYWWVTAPVPAPATPEVKLSEKERKYRELRESMDIKTPEVA